MFRFVQALLLVSLFLQFSNASELVSEDLLVPKLFQLDSYDDCLATKVKFSIPVYCIVEVYIKPNKSNNAWMIIEKSSLALKTHYKHDHLVYGVCISRCKNFMKKFDKLTQLEYFNQTPKKFTSIGDDPFTFAGAIEDDVEFGELVNECINYELKKRYQLVANSKIQYCEGNGRVDEIGKFTQTFNFSSKEEKIIF